MADFMESKTAKNLAFAFAGESQARNKYTYFASVARKEGYNQIAAIFEETAGNEKEHAKLWFKHLNGIGDTVANLEAAAAGEHEEWTSMYADFAKEAQAGQALTGLRHGIDLYGRGRAVHRAGHHTLQISDVMQFFDQIAALFEGVAAIEREHEERYRKLVENIRKGEVFARVAPQKWICLNCGHVYIGEKAPEICPVCKHPKAYFEITAENF